MLAAASRRRLASASWRNLKQSVAGWKDMLTSLGNIGFKPERWSMDEAGNMTKLANAQGVGGMKGGAMLAAGAMLAMDGLRRGGKIGVAETTGGRRAHRREVRRAVGRGSSARSPGSSPAMVRLFIKGAQEKAREKIKDLYGVDISDKAILQQIVDTAKQTYGGNLDMAIRTDEIRDLIELYAMSTGQPTKGMPATVHPLELAQSGGSLYQSPGYSNGTRAPRLGRASLARQHRRRRGVRSGSGRDPVGWTGDDGPPARRGGERHRQQPARRRGRVDECGAVQRWPAGVDQPPDESRPGDLVMPGSVANAAPATVMPNSLSRAFVHTREYPVIDNEYRNGESQRSAQAATSRKKWSLTKRLTPSQLASAPGRSTMRGTEPTNRSTFTTRTRRTRSSRTTRPARR